MRTYIIYGFLLCLTKFHSSRWVYWMRSLERNDLQICSGSRSSSFDAFPDHVFIRWPLRLVFSYAIIHEFTRSSSTDWYYYRIVGIGLIDGAEWRNGRWIWLHHRGEAFDHILRSPNWESVIPAEAPFLDLSAKVIYWLPPAQVGIVERVFAHAQ